MVRSPQVICGRQVGHFDNFYCANGLKIVVFSHPDIRILFSINNFLVIIDVLIIFVLTRNMKKFKLKLTLFNQYIRIVIK